MKVKNVRPRVRKSLSPRGSSGRASAPLGRVFGDRLRTTLKLRGVSQAAFATELGVQPNQISYWLAGRNHPGAASLRRIAQFTGVSVDWLLGFDDAPMIRAERARIGSLANELKPALMAGRPEESNAFPVPAFTNPDLLLSQVIEGWWGSMLSRCAAEAATRLELLAARLETDSTVFASLTAMLLYRARQFRTHSMSLRSPYVTWKALSGFERPSSLIADNALLDQLREARAIPKVRGPREVLFTPFDVWGGGASAGVAWRGEEIDYLWYVDSSTLQVVQRHGRGLLNPVEGFRPSFKDAGIKQ